jgi:transposase, IS30 family
VGAVLFADGSGGSSAVLGGDGAGDFITDAAVAAPTYRVQGHRWLIADGGVRPRRGRNLKGRCLTFAEREEIALGRAAGESMRSIASRLGRSPSTISLELARNGEAPGRYRATSAHAAAWERAARPKRCKLATNVALRYKVEQDLERKYSPEQIAGRVKQDCPHDPEMWVSAGTIYQSLYVQSRGALRRELTRCLRTGRAAAGWCALSCGIDRYQRGPSCLWNVRANLSIRRS